MGIVLISLFRDFLQLSKEVTEALKQAGILPDVNGSTRTETPSPESPVAGPSGASGGLLQPDGEEDRYKRALKPLQYEGIEFASKMSFIQTMILILILSSCLGHTYLSELDSTSLTSKTICRIAHEIATISSAESLPSSISSSIFVRSDDTKMPLLKAVITG